MYNDLLKYWFGSADPDGTFAFRSVWFRTDADFDAGLRSRFAALYTQACNGQLAHWAAEPQSALAQVILLDQLSRNLNRDSPLTWAQDAQVRTLTRDALARGHDQALPPIQRTFLYMPLMHSEDLRDQDQALALFETLAGVAPGRLDGSLKAARSHRDIVARFGRFPHRNKVLGRESTAEEQAFLETPGSSF
jgi:uncharacterized protein (DUF924 family)